MEKVDRPSMTSAGAAGHDRGRMCAIPVPKRAQEILDHFEEYLPKFKKIIPAGLQADAAAVVPV